MRFSLSRRRFGFDRDLRRVLAHATRDSLMGVDSVRLLDAILSDAAGAKTIIQIVGSLPTFRDPAVEASEQLGGPGITEDGKLAIEYAMHRSLEKARDANITDLLMGLVSTDCRAYRILAAHGVAERIRSSIEA